VPILRLRPVRAEDLPTLAQGGVGGAEDGGTGTAGVDTGVTARVSVAERAGSPVVGELIVTNEGARPVLLLEGELLEGGWQHRTLVHDLLLAPGSSRVVEVACVEHGR